jgi:membrane protease YdiL (CAAX protease family)
MNATVVDAGPGRRQGFAARLGESPVIGFFGLAYAISWSLWLLSYLLGGGGLGRAVFLLGGFGPMAAAAIVTHQTGGSVSGWLRSIFTLRAKGRFYLYALGLPAAVYALVNLVLALAGKPVELSLLPGRIPDYLMTLAFVAVLGGGQEEPGWRGFALPLLQEKHAPVKATLILGFLWGIWHVPLYGPLGFVVPMVLAFFYTYLFNKTGSALLCVLLHGSFTAAQDHLTLLDDITGGLTDAAIGLSYLAGVILLVALTRRRLGGPRFSPKVEGTSKRGE